MFTKGRCIAFMTVLGVIAGVSYIYSKGNITVLASNSYKSSISESSDDALLTGAVEHSEANWVTLQDGNSISKQELKNTEGAKLFSTAIKE